MNVVSVENVTRAPPIRQVAAVVAGCGLEFYDFVTYAFFATQIGRAFFPSADPTASLLASLATFGAGFLMRPIGALVIGRMGDRLGRRPAMILSFGLMGVAMVGLALVPPHSRIGMAAPILAILCRLIQGFALGGEIGPAAAYLAEVAPAGRRGFYLSLQMMAQQGAVLVAGLVGFVLAQSLSAAALDAWGWRVAFLLGAMIVPVGAIIRRSLVDTLHTGKLAPAVEPKGDSIARTSVIGVVILAGGTTVTYVVNYLNTYATATLHMSAQLGFAATIVTGATGVIGYPIGGWLSDRIGRRPMMIFPWLILLIVALPAFGLLTHLKSIGPLLGLAILLALTSAFAMSATLAWLAEALPAHKRSSVFGLIYALSISVFGGSTQFTVAWLTRLTGSSLAPAYYMTVAVAVSLLAMLFSRESKRI